MDRVLPVEQAAFGVTMTEGSAVRVDPATGLKIFNTRAGKATANIDGNRIQREVAEYSELSQQVMQLTNIISESVKKLPTVPGINH